jgi:hypothetical protein
MDAGGAPSPRELADRPPPGAAAARASAMGAIVLCGARRCKLPPGTRSRAPPRGSVTTADAWAEGTEVDHDSGSGGERGDRSAVRSGEEACLERRRGAVGFGERWRRRGMERIGGGGVPMWRGNRGGGAVEGLGSGGADTSFLARCEGEGDAFFSFLVLLDRPSADACGTSGVGNMRSGGARGKARVQGEGAEVDGQR